MTPQTFQRVRKAQQTSGIARAPPGPARARESARLTTSVCAADNRFAAFGNMMLVLTLFPSIFGFYFSLKVGSRVANARVKVAAAKVKQWKFSAENEALEPDVEEELWRANVVEPTFALAETTLPTLSEGWGRGIGFMAIGSWCFVAG